MAVSGTTENTSAEKRCGLWKSMQEIVEWFDQQF